MACAGLKSQVYHFYIVIFPHKSIYQIAKDTPSASQRVVTVQREASISLLGDWEGYQ